MKKGLFVGAILIVSSWVFASSVVLTADVKLRTGEIIHGEIRGRIVLKKTNKHDPKVKDGVTYILFQGRDVVAIDEIGVRLKGHVTVASISSESPVSDVEALSYFGEDGGGFLNSGNGSHNAFSTGTKHDKIWDPFYKAALDPYVRNETKGTRFILGSGFALLGEFDGEQILPSLEVTTTTPKGEKVLSSIAVQDVMQFK
jgi:hypothetical protein